MLARLIANCTTRATRFEPGNISTKREADAALATQALESRAQQVASDMLKLDDSADDLNPKIPHNVYLAKTNNSGFTGHAVKSDGGSVSRLDAESGAEQVKVSTEGNRKEVHRVHIQEGPAGEKALWTEEWAISDGSTVKYKSIEYWDYVK